MNNNDPPPDMDSGDVIETIIVSHVRAYREMWFPVLDPDENFSIVRAFSGPVETLAAARTFRPDMVLIDAALPGGLVLVRRLRAELPDARLVAMPLPETEAAILAWAEAGISGYVADSAALADLPRLLREIAMGRQSCSLKIAGVLLRRAGLGAELAAPAGESAALTAREREILVLLGAGKTNKEIARRLDIGVGTAKCHVHSVLTKLRLTSRSRVAAVMNGGGIAALDY
jgi:two-component system, NarL family, nitrate/nitrite response regulator NarL